MNIYDFINFLRRKYDIFKNSPYAFDRWKDSLFDYMDITKMTSGKSYALIKPEDSTPETWINDYITNIFYEYFPGKDRIYLDD